MVLVWGCCCSSGWRPCRGVRADPHVSALDALERAGEAIAAVENGHATGKIVL